MHLTFSHSIENHVDQDVCSSAAGSITVKMKTQTIETIERTEHSFSLTSSGILRYYAGLLPLFHISFFERASPAVYNDGAGPPSVALVHLPERKKAHHE